MKPTPPLIVTCKNCNKMLIWEGGGKTRFILKKNLCLNCYRFLNKEKKFCKICNKPVGYNRVTYCSKDCARKGNLKYQIEYQIKRDKRYNTLTTAEKLEAMKNFSKSLEERQEEKIEDEDYIDEEQEERLEQELYYSLTGEYRKQSSGTSFSRLLSKTGVNPYQKKRNYFMFRAIYDELKEKEYDDAVICKVLRINPLRLKAFLRKWKQRNETYHQEYEEYLRLLKGGNCESGKRKNK